MSQVGADPPFLYDVYVSYSREDGGWVEETLAPRLAAAGRRVFLEHDLPPGGLEIEERDRAVALSRKTLLILSRADHQWARLDEALTRVLDPAARKRRLIPVLRADCEPPLRIRTLVWVDLRRDDPGQWRRLLAAVDPRQEPAVSPVQRLSLRLAEAVPAPAPTWHPAGAAWLAAAYGALAAVLALIHLLLWEAPPLRHALTLLLAAPSHALAALVWREDRDAFRRLSHLVAASRAGRGAVALAAAAAAAVWGWAGVPAARAALCGPWGCKEAGSLYLTVADFQSLTPGPEAEGWTRGLRRVLEQKLGAAPGVQVFGLDLPQIDAEARQRLRVDYTIAGQVAGRPTPTLTAFLYDRQLRPSPPPVTVEAGPEADPAGGDGSFARLQALEDRLALALLERLDVDLTAAEIRGLARIPTAEPRAARLNEEAFELRRAGRLAEAEARLRAALALDDGYSVAWSNLAEVAWRGGRHEEALAYRRAAVERLPTYAPFQYNLGHLLAFLGRSQEALAPLTEAARLDRAHVPTYNELGQVLLELGEPRRAVDVLEKGRLLDPEFAPLAKNLGRALLAAGDPGAAVAPLERSLTLYPAADWLGRAEAHSLLVQALARQGEDQAACRHLGALRRLDPEGVAPWTPAAETAAAALTCPAQEDPHA